MFTVIYLLYYKRTYSTRINRKLTAVISNLFNKIGRINTEIKDFLWNLSDKVFFDDNAVNVVIVKKSDTQIVVATPEFTQLIAQVPFVC